MVPLGELAIQDGLLDRPQLADILEHQRASWAKADFRRVGEHLVERLGVAREAIRPLLERQEIQIVACERCSTSYNGVQFQGGKPCLRCGHRLYPTAATEPLSVEDAIAEPHEAGRRLLSAHQEKNPRVGRFKLLGQISPTTYKAWDPSLQRHVALSFVPNAEDLTREERSRFERYAQARIGLRHGHLVRARSLEAQEPGQLFLALDFLAGVPLDLYQRTNTLGGEQLVWICAQIANALQAAHEGGIVHGGISPGAVLVDHAGKPFLVDFGVPERAADAASDVHALGVLLYNALGAGANPGIPPLLASLVDRAASLDPASRFDSAGELARGLEGFLGN